MKSLLNTRNFQRLSSAGVPGMFSAKAILNKDSKATIVTIIFLYIMFPSHTVYNRLDSEAVALVFGFYDSSTSTAAWVIIVAHFPKKY